jgi:hypothetical protein
VKVNPPAVLKPVDEASFVSTNAALVGNYLP